MTQHTDEPTSDPSAHQSGEDLPLIELETILNRPSSRRKRLAQLGLLLAAAVVALALFWGANVPGTSVAPTRVPAPTTSPPMVLILSNVNYGTVTVNGKKQPGQVPIVVPMHGDTYDITLDAPPFLPKSCHVEVSQATAPGDPCQAYPLASPPNMMMINGVTVAPTFELNIALTLNDLPPVQQNKVTAALTQALTYRQEMTVPVGSYFATNIDAAGKISSQRASVPLQASAIVGPFIPHQYDGYAPCVSFICAGGFEMQTAPSSFDDQWEIMVSVAPRWRFASTSGVVVSDVPFQQMNTVTLFLSYDGAEGWFVPPITPPTGPTNNQLTSTFCATGQTMLGHLAESANNTSIGTSDDRGARGCFLVLDANGADQGMYLWRFGVLLAVDPTAHAAHPELPVAPPEEVAAVQQP